jgi:uncharacterized protein YjiS (DUF1127 family)
MTILSMRSEAPAGVRAGRSIAAGASKAIASILQALRRQRTRRDLAHFDDQMLRDIGLSRYEVEMELRRPWWRV